MQILLSADDRAFATEMREFFTTQIPGEIRTRLARGEPATRQDVVRSQKILNDHGLAVPHWPAEWGGRDWTPIRRHLWAEEMSAAHVPAPIVFNTAMVGPVIATFGSQQVKQRFLPPTASADIWWAQGFSEPNAGSDLAGVRTTAVREGNQYVLNGQKTWTTLAQHANWIFCLVRTDPGAQKQRGISFLLVDLSSPGVTVRPIPLIDGDAEVNEVFFEDVRVPVDQLVGEENQGWAYAKFLLGNERTSNAGIGIIKDRIRRIRRVAHERMNEPLFRARLCHLEIETVALEATVLRVLDREASLLPGVPDPVSSILKLRGTELQQEASEMLVDAFGHAALVDRTGAASAGASGSFIDESAHAFPTYVNWRKASIYAGSNEIQRTIIAKNILGL